MGSFISMFEVEECNSMSENEADYMCVVDIKSSFIACREENTETLFFV